VQPNSLYSFEETNMSKLHFRYGAMESAKSAHLLLIEHNYMSHGGRCLLLTAAVDDRFGEGLIASRLGISSPAQTFSPETDMSCSSTGTLYLTLSSVRFSSTRRNSSKVSRFRTFIVPSMRSMFR
jgi:hypothetical protein